MNRAAAGIKSADRGCHSCEWFAPRAAYPDQWRRSWPPALEWAAEVGVRLDPIDQQDMVRPSAVALKKIGRCRGS
jgi:hypothetical protein